MSKRKSVKSTSRRRTCLLKHEAEHNVEESYEVGEVLGRGGFGIVCAARGRLCGRCCVLKVVDRSAVSDPSKLDDEVEIHASLDHPNIVKVYEHFVDQSQLCVVMELCRGGELFDVLQSRGGAVSEVEAKNIFVQVMHAVHYMHSQHLAHRDLKPQNFLIKETDTSLSKCTVKLIDFGMAAPFEEGKVSLKTICGTPGYMAPELLCGAGYDESCDIWSCGAILFNLLFGCMPFSGRTIEETLRNTKRLPVRLPKRASQAVSRAARCMVLRTLCKKPAKRLTAQAVLSDDWLQAVRVKARKATVALVAPQMLDNLQEFGEMSALEQESLHRVAYHLEDADVRGMRQVFLQLDANADGKLTKEEVLEGLSKSELPAKDLARLEELFDVADSDGNGLLDYTEFLAAMMGRQGRLSHQACVAAFRSFDVDKSGTISVKEIRHVLAEEHSTGARDGGSSAGHSCTESLEKLLERCDSDGDGEISFEEFVRMLRGCPQVPASPSFAAHGGA